MEMIWASARGLYVSSFAMIQILMETVSSFKEFFYCTGVKLSVVFC